MEKSNGINGVNRIGFLVPHLGFSQMAFNLINNTNWHLHKNTECDVMVFYENISYPCAKNEFAISNVVDGWNYSGSMIATTYQTATKILRFPSCSQRYFYCYDLEWIGMPQKQYGELAKIYENKNVHILARSDEHAAIIERCWSTKVLDVVGDFDMTKIDNITRQQNEKS
jgi:hypothetical protein